MDAILSILIRNKLIYFNLLVVAIVGQQQLTFTDVKQHQKLIVQITATFTNGDPVKCLTHCLSNRAKCKAINVNRVLERCELLEHSADEGLELTNAEGWTYYGPKDQHFEEEYKNCHEVKSLINQKKYCCPKGKTGDRCQYPASCAFKYNGICHDSTGNQQVTGKELLGNFSTPYKCYEQCQKLFLKDPTKWTACETYQDLSGHKCYILTSDVKLGKPTSLYRAFYSNCWVFQQKCIGDNQTFSCHFIDRKAYAPQPVFSTVKSSREACAEECYRQKQSLNHSINAVQYAKVTSNCECLVGLQSINTGPETTEYEGVEVCVINQEKWLPERAINLTEALVLSTDHDNGSVDQVFNFMRSDLNLGLNEIKDVVVYNSRTSVVGEATVWGFINEGSIGDAHGVFKNIAGPQWKVGDKIVLVDSLMPNLEGKSASDPGISCRRLKERFPHYQSGYYWVKYALRNGVARQYCDMNDGKGWMMIGHTKIDATTDLAQNLGYSITEHPTHFFGDITSTNILLSRYSLIAISAYNEVTELRFRCAKQWHGRTLDVVVKEESYARRTFTKYNAQSREDFFCSRNPGSTPNIIQFLPDDNSIMGNHQCGDIRGNSFIYSFPLWITSTSHINVFDEPRVECDDYYYEADPDPSFRTEGEWWFYVR